MTSAPKKQQNQLIVTRGEGVKKSENFADIIYGSPLTPKTLPLYFSCSHPRARLMAFMRGKTSAELSPWKSSVSTDHTKAPARFMWLAN